MPSLNVRSKCTSSLAPIYNVAGARGVIVMSRLDMQSRKSAIAARKTPIVQTSPSTHMAGMTIPTTKAIGAPIVVRKTSLAVGDINVARPHAGSRLLQLHRLFALQSLQRVRG